jgi:hypothetical protein
MGRVAWFLSLDFPFFLAVFETVAWVESGVPITDWGTGW